ncbi:ATP-dependent DNA ligase [Dendrothele bispora CBS 962.96]|uniref:DNA ligase n=1 Tax=Dendrothele bispora (strain CBS 962.96) TaxID=1314807 RepID=A0A4S8M0S8_DENBC|nr:ATP-dependent DNA ligase [Dendrothele bispora CBS 962.96]
MSKRASSHSTPSPKRKKAPGNQTRLDAFFSAPRQQPQAGISKSTANSGSVDRKRAPDVIDVDLLDDNLQPIPQRTEESEETEPKVSASSSLSSSNATLKSPTKFIHSKVTFEDILPPTYETLSVDPVTFDPESYVLPSSTPEIPYSFLAHALSTICGTRSRIAILDTLTNTFRTILVRHPQSLLPAVYLLSNTMSPPYSSVELNIGPSVISQAIQHISGLSSSSLKKLYNSLGDIGDVAYAAKSNTRTLIPHPPLRVSFVYETMTKVARASGQGAAKQKQKLVETLLVAAKGEESRFLARTLSQNLRVGAVRTSLLTALARSFVLSSKCRASAAECPYHISAQALVAIRPIPTDRKKGTGSASDPGRETVNTALREAEALVRKVFVQHPDYGHILEALVVDGLESLAEKVPLTVGIPIYPTLGTPIRSFQELYENLRDLPFSAELKYDGQRAQIHGDRQSDGNTVVRLFSRHLEDMTSKYPDVVALVEEIFEHSPQIQSCILDAEIVAIDPQDGSLRNFQTLAGRARKDVRLDNVLANVAVFAFDLMYFNRQILLDHSFRSRRTLLHEHFPPFVPQRRELARFQHVERCDSENGRSLLEEFWQTVVNRHDTEGLMVKLLDNEPESEEQTTQVPSRRSKPLRAVYDADKRTNAWMKLKKDYVTGLGDSLDLVPIGAWYGNGRKARWWSPILLGVWDPQKGYVVGVCKCMSGFSDNFYKALSDRYKLTEDSETCSKTARWECETGGLRPDVYFKPQEVWEIRGAEVTLSPVSVAAVGLVSPSKGLSLRFPRFIRIRDEKAVQQASDTTFLANLWRKQQGNTENVDGGDELIDVDLRSSTGESDGSDLYA